ncbi:MAG TPA: hypothetical protein DEP53_01580 [Bacteroidetes bacterium]|nr:hypothetical protein [Bacteroidota bacterium]
MPGRSIKDFVGNPEASWRRNDVGILDRRYCILWLYSMTIVIMRDGYTSLTPGGALFAPFVPAEIWSMSYLRKKREFF